MSDLYSHPDYLEGVETLRRRYTEYPRVFAGPVDTAQTPWLISTVTSCITQADFIRLCDSLADAFRLPRGSVVPERSHEGGIVFSHGPYIRSFRFGLLYSAEKNHFFDNSLWPCGSFVSYEDWKNSTTRLIDPSHKFVWDLRVRGNPYTTENLWTETEIKRLRKCMSQFGIKTSSEFKWRLEDLTKEFRELAAKA